MKLKAGVIAITVVILFTLAIVLFREKSSKIKSPVNETLTNLSNQPPVISDKSKEYVDPSGFKFQYPDDVSVSTLSADSDKIYSSLELKSPKTKGSITVKVTETQLVSLNQWLKENKLNTSGSAIIKDIKLADFDAKEIQTNNKLLAVALDNNTLFEIAADFSNNKDYWMDVYRKVLTTYSFFQPQEQAPINEESAQQNEDSVYEEEEVVE